MIHTLRCTRSAAVGLLLLTAQAASSEPGPPGANEPDRGQLLSDPPTLTLLESIGIALEGNLDLRAAFETLRADAQRSQQERSRLLPQIAAGLEGRRIDSSRAEAGLGRQPETRTSGMLRLDQVIYSEERLARLDIERSLQAARVARQEERSLDVVLAAGTAYLELLRTEALARIRAEEVELNRSNLERATARLDLGAANRSEVLRWETALARSRSAEAAAAARVTAARLELNRVMNRPLTDHYRTVDPTLSDPYFLIADAAVLALLEDQSGRHRLRRFYVDEAFRHAPLLARLREEISARRRALASGERSFTHPTLTASAIVEHELSRHGRGTEELDIDFAEIFPELPSDGSTRIGGRTDDLEWTVALRASLPLYQGGMRRAQVQEERARLDALLLEQDGLMQRLEAEILARAHAAEASFDSIDHAETAARAGRANLELVQDAYTQGVLTIIDLLDAQTAALAADLEAANAVFDFLLDYLAVQRSTGRFDITASAADLAERRARLASFQQGQR